MTHGHLGCRSCAICGRFHSTTGPGPPKHRSSPSLAWSLAGKILRRKRHERQQGGLTREGNPNACSSRAVVPACLLAVSEGRTLAAGRLEHRCDHSRAGEWRGVGNFLDLQGSSQDYSRLPPCVTELREAHARFHPAGKPDSAVRMRGRCVPSYA